MSDPSPLVAPRRGVLRRLADRVTSTSADIDAKELHADALDLGCTPLQAVVPGAHTNISGTIRALTLRPVGGVPALEAELFDGTGVLLLVWLGRRRIRGIDPGRDLTVHGRVTLQSGRLVMFNPAYELRA
jgi:hypothetical protein